MKEYIERAAVKDEILSWAVCINHPELLSKEDTMYCIDNIPAADVAPVRHGRWINVCGYDLAECSECKAVFDVANQYTDPTKQDFEEFCKIHRFCPACGALMNGKEADHD